MKNLTLNDNTQAALLPHLAVTENLLARAAAEASCKPALAEIVALPDLGMPHNVTRVRGGFFTGGLYRWESECPIVPIDATVNVDTLSIFRMNPVADEREFRTRIARARAVVMDGWGRCDPSCYVWNYSVGNHFVTYGVSTGSPAVPAGAYLALHSSASEFKYQHNGLYPREGNWFWDAVRTVEDSASGRFLRYICDEPAAQFVALAKDLVAYNRHRHRYVAGLVAGEGAALKEVISVPHYGMPTDRAIAIGCQWVKQGDIVPLLTGPRRPIFLIRVGAAENNYAETGGGRLTLFPHGLGKQAKTSLSLRWIDQAVELNGRLYRDGDSFENDPTLELRDVFGDGPPSDLPSAFDSILDLCPGEIVGRIDPLYSYARESDSLPEGVL